MIFIRSQALDNMSDDPCVLDGVLVSASDPAAATAIDALSETARHGQSWTGGSTRITNGPAAVAIRIDTGERDDAGRPSPVVALIDRGWLKDLDGAVDGIAAFTRLLHRTIDVDRLSADLRCWRDLGKARSGRLARVGRRFLRRWKALAAPLRRRSRRWGRR
ncbi:MAG: hypothetical protein HOY76_31360 [Streptomyces sp.]|nr:hypothetical protein [Streptomyces sp.]NUS15200.1 hypothetical protein [Streptomyces sp.]